MKHIHVLLPILFGFGLRNQLQSMLAQSGSSSGTTLQALIYAVCMHVCLSSRMLCWVLERVVRQGWGLGRVAEAGGGGLAESQLPRQGIIFGAILTPPPPAFRFCLPCTSFCSFDVPTACFLLRSGCRDATLLPHYTRREYCLSSFCVLASPLPTVWTTTLGPSVALKQGCGSVYSKTHGP